MNPSSTKTAEAPQLSDEDVKTPDLLADTNAIIPDTVAAFRAGWVDMMASWKTAKIMNTAEQAPQRGHQEEQDLKDRLLEGDEDGSLTSKEVLDTRGRPAIDVTKIKREDTRQFDSSFEMGDLGEDCYEAHHVLKVFYKYSKNKSRGRRTATIRLPLGFLTENAIDHWYAYIPAAMSALLTLYPESLPEGKSEYPHLKWAGNLASQMVLHRLPFEVDELVLGFSILRPNPPEDPIETITPVVTFQRPQEGKTYIPVQILLPRSTPVYPGRKEFRFTRSLLSFRQENPPPFPPVSSTIFGNLRISKDIVDAVDSPYTPEQKDLVPMAVKWCEWLCSQVANAGKYGLSYDDWYNLFDEFMPTCLKDNIQSQQKHLSERYFTIQKVKDDSRCFRLIAVKSGFLDSQPYSIARLPIYLKNMTPTQAGQYSVWLNKRYSRCRDVGLALKEFSMHVDTNQGYDYVWQNATNCSHRLFDGSHPCVVCENELVPCLDLIPGRGAMCQGCLKEVAVQSAQEYLQIHYEMKSTSRNEDSYSAVLHSGLEKHESYMTRTEALKHKGYLKTSKLEDLRSTVLSWADVNREIEDKVCGLGGLHKLSKKAGYDNKLLLPSVVRKTRAYVDVKTNETYLFHHLNLEPTVAAVGIMSATNSLAATILLIKAARLAQTRWDDVVSDNPNEEALVIQRAMRRINNDLASLHLVQTQIPYRISDIAVTNPKVLNKAIVSLLHSLQALGISTKST